MNFDHYCIYLAGFDRLGRHLYGSWWTGNEHHAYPVDAPEEITEERQQILANIDKTLDQINEVRNKRRSSLLSYQQSTELDAIYEAASLQNTELNQRLNDLPRSIESHSIDYDNYQRRRATEEYLQQALENGIILGWFGISPMGMHWSDWGNKDGFVLYPELSIVRTPLVGKSRRLPFFFKISELDGWLETIEPINPEAKPKPTDYETYQILIREFHLTLNGRVSKSRFEEYVRSKVDRFRPRIFNKAWADEKSIPGKWKDPGNIPKSERHKE